MGTYDAQEIDIARESLEKTRVDDEFWSKTSEVNLGDNEFVNSEFTESVSRSVNASNYL
jgi:hypothetical protein